MDPRCCCISELSCIFPEQNSWGFSFDPPALQSSRQLTRAKKNQFWVSSMSAALSEPSFQMFHEMFFEGHSNFEQVILMSCELKNNHFLTFFFHSLIFTFLPQQPTLPSATNNFALSVTDHVVILSSHVNLCVTKTCTNSACIFITNVNVNECWSIGLEMITDTKCYICLEKKLLFSEIPQN